MNLNKWVLFLGEVKKSKRIFYFDALRALAIITVITFHVGLRTKGLISYSPGVIPPFRWIFTDFMLNPMRCGVDIFLMLSGALSLGRDWETFGFLKKKTYKNYLSVCLLAICTFRTDNSDFLLLSVIHTK